MNGSPPARGSRKAPLPRILVFDIETRVDLFAKYPDLDEEEVWERMRRGEAGVGVIAIWDSVENWTYFFDDTEIDLAAAYLESADVVVGFYSKGFDLPVVESLVGRKLALRNHVDLLEDVWAALRTRDPFGRMKGYKLGDLSMRCLGRGKLEKGEHAPLLFQQGKHARAFRYCADDVRLTRDVLLYMLEHGGVIDAGGHFLSVSLPPMLSALRGPS